MFPRMGKCWWMLVISLERSWKDAPAFFTPQDGPVATSKLGIGARLRQGPAYGESAVT